MRILYCGIPLGALALLEDGHELCAACISRPSYPGMRRLRAKLAQKAAPLFARPDLGDVELRRVLQSTRADLLVSFFWHQRIPASIRAIPAQGAIGVHPSLLPRHRGADPYFWTLRFADEMTGVAVHVLDEGYDTGAVLACRQMPVPRHVDSWGLALALDRLALALLREVCGAIARGQAPQPRAQDESRATLAPEPTDDDLEIRWSSGSDEILSLIRAAAPEPGAFSAFGERTITIVRASRTAHRIEPRVAVLMDDGLLVGTADFAIRVDRARVADIDEGRTLSGAELALVLTGVSDLRGRP